MMDPQSEVLLLAEPFECALQVSTIYFVTAPESTQSDVLKTGAASEPLICCSCAGVAIRSLIPLLIQIGRRRNPGGAGLVFSASGIWSSLIPLRKNPRMFKECVWARIAPSHCAHFAPPEMPANATGHCVDFGQSRCTTSSPAARSASLQPTE